MHENVRTNNVRNEAHGKRDCCTPDSNAKAALSADPKAKFGGKAEPDAQKSAEAGCCCGSKSPKR